MPIRLRLTLWFSVILCTILLLSGIVLNFTLTRALYQDLDNNLTAYSAQVHGTLHGGNPTDTLDYNVIHDKLPPINEFASPRIYIQIIDDNGKVVVKSDNLGDQELPVDPALIQSGFNGNVAFC